MPQEPMTTGLSTAGLIFMTVSVTFVTVLVGWCFYRVLTTQEEEPPESVRDFHSA